MSKKLKTDLNKLKKERSLYDKILYFFEKQFKELNRISLNIKKENKNLYNLKNNYYNMLIEASNKTDNLLSLKKEAINNIINKNNNNNIQIIPIRKTNSIQIKNDPNLDYNILNKAHKLLKNDNYFENKLKEYIYNEFKTETNNFNDIYNNLVTENSYIALLLDEAKQRSISKKTITVNDNIITLTKEIKNIKIQINNINNNIRSILLNQNKNKNLLKKYDNHNKIIKQKLILYQHIDPLSIGLSSDILNLISYKYNQLNAINNNTKNINKSFAFRNIKTNISNIGNIELFKLSESYSSTRITNIKNSLFNSFKTNN